MSLKGCCTSGCVEDCSSEVKEDISRKISCQNVFYVSPSVSLCLCLCTSVRWSLIQVFLRLIKNNVFWINDLYFIRIIQSVDYQRGQMFTSSLTYLVCVARSCRPSHCKLKLLCFFLLLFMLFFSSLLLNHIWHSTNAFFFKVVFYLCSTDCLLLCKSNVWMSPCVTPGAPHSLFLHFVASVSLRYNSDFVSKGLNHFSATTTFTQIITFQRLTMHVRAFKQWTL